MKDHRKTGARGEMRVMMHLKYHNSKGLGRDATKYPNTLTGMGLEKSNGSGDRVRNIQR